MDNLNDLYLISVKNKHFLPHIVLLVMGMIKKREAKANEVSEEVYLGDNIPLNLIERIGR